MVGVDKVGTHGGDHGRGHGRGSWWEGGMVEDWTMVRTKIENHGRGGIDVGNGWGHGWGLVDGGSLIGLGFVMRYTIKIRNVKKDLFI